MAKGRCKKAFKTAYRSIRDEVRTALVDPLLLHLAAVITAGLTDSIRLGKLDWSDAERIAVDGLKKVRANLSTAAAQAVVALVVRALKQGTPVDVIGRADPAEVADALDLLGSKAGDAEDDNADNGIVLG